MFRRLFFAACCLLPAAGFSSLQAADLSITAASVANISANTSTGTAGGAITAGQAVYLSAGTILPANATSATAYKAVGIALNPAATGQPVTYAINGGTINLGATLTVSETYFVSKTGSGLIMPVGDKASTNYMFRLGYATAAGVLVLDFKDYGVQAP